MAKRSRKKTRAGSELPRLPGTEAGKGLQDALESSCPTNDLHRRVSTIMKWILADGFIKVMKEEELELNVRCRVAIAPGSSEIQFRESIFRAMEEGRLSTEVISNEQLVDFLEKEYLAGRITIQSERPHLRKRAESALDSILGAGFMRRDGMDRRLTYTVSVAPDRRMDDLVEFAMEALEDGRLSNTIISNQQTIAFVNQARAEGLVMIRRGKKEK